MAEETAINPNATEEPTAPPPEGEEYGGGGSPSKSPSRTPTVTIKDDRKPGKSGLKPEDCIPDFPSGEELPPDEIDKIIASMLAILQECQRKVDDQKIDSHSLVFMLLRIKESLDAYNCDYFQKINSFLVQAEKITAAYYCHMACSLPQYGDYIESIEAEKSDLVDAGEQAPPVKKNELLNLVRTVTDNYYATGMFIKSGRMLFKDVNNSQPERQDIVDKINTPLPKWMEFQDKVTSQLEQIRDQTFKISAYVDFLKQGEMKMAPILDLSTLNHHKADSGLKNCPKDPDQTTSLTPSNHHEDESGLKPFPKSPDHKKTHSPSSESQPLDNTPPFHAPPPESWPHGH